MLQIEVKSGQRLRTGASGATGASGGVRLAVASSNSADFFAPLFRFICAASALGLRRQMPRAPSVCH